MAMDKAVMTAAIDVVLLSSLKSTISRYVFNKTIMDQIIAKEHYLKSCRALPESSPASPLSTLSMSIARTYNTSISPTYASHSMENKWDATGIYRAARYLFSDIWPLWSSTKSHKTLVDDNRRVSSIFSYLSKYLYFHPYR